MLKIYQITPKQLLNLFISFLILCGVCLAQGQHAQEDNDGKDFEPVYFERVHSVIIKANSDSVFSLLGPRGTRLLSDQEVDFLYGNEEELEGALFRVYIHNSWAYYSVGQYNPEARIYRTTVLMPETEFWMSEFTVESLDSGNSKLNVRWRISGYHKNSNEAIQGYIDHDLQNNLFEQSVINAGQRIENFIKNQSE